MNGKVIEKRELLGLKTPGFEQDPIWNANFANIVQRR